jgi:hypothetical protein
MTVPSKNPLNTTSTLALELGIEARRAAPAVPVIDARQLWEALGRPHKQFRSWAGYYITPLLLCDETAGHVEARSAPRGLRSGKPAKDYLLSRTVAARLSSMVRTPEGDAFRVQIPPVGALNFEEPDGLDQLDLDQLLLDAACLLGCAAYRLRERAEVLSRRGDPFKSLGLFSAADALSRARDALDDCEELAAFDSKARAEMRTPPSSERTRSA